MPESIRRWLSPPAFGDEDRDAKARSLYPILLLSLAVSILALAGHMLIGNFLTAYGIFGTICSVSVMTLLLRRGRLAASSTLLLVTALVVTVYFQWFGNGLLDVAIIMYPTLVIIASLLVSPRQFIAVTVLSFLALGLVILGHLSGRLDSRGINPSELALEGLFAGFMLSLTALTGHLFSRNIRQNLARARESEERYRELVQNASSIILRWNRTGTIVFLNEFGQQFFGYEQHDLPGKPVMGTIVPETEQGGRDLRDLMEEIFLHPERFEHNVNQNMRKNGDLVWVEWKNKAIRDRDGAVVEMFSVGTDVTERKRSEEERERRERDLLRAHHALVDLHARASLQADRETGGVIREALVSASSVLGVERASAWLLDGERLVCSNLYERSSGRFSSGMVLQAAEYPGYFSAIHEQRAIDASDARSDPRTREFAKSYLEPLGITSMLDTSIRKDGVLCGVLCFEHVGEPRAWTEEDVVFSTDISGFVTLAIMRGERAHAEERYRALVDSVPVGIFTSQYDGRILFANNRLAQILEIHDPKEVLALNTATLYKNPEDRQRFLERLARDGKVDEFEFTAVTPKGTGKILQLSAYCDGDAISGLIEDVTERHQAEQERRQLEDQLRQSQKMEAIGTLAGGIAHDFNNILSIILGYAEMTLLKVPGGSPEAGDIEQIIMASDRATQLVSQILTFSRRAETKPVSCDIGPIVKETLKFLRSSLPTSIEIRESMGAVGAVVVDPTQLHQVVMNLGTNAYHAMQQRGGVLEISLGEVRIEAADPAHQDLAAGSYARLTVSDTGTGIAPEVIGRIFEPYFTTKEAGKGTGLGLSVVHGIVTAAGGAIRVYSEPGLGTTFHLYLPLAPTLTPVSEDRPDDAPRGTERVLFVDDEPMIVAMWQESLEALGYRVTTTTRPEEALAAFLEDPAQFDLVITDLTMPKLNGEALAQAVLQARPGMPVLICTGFSEALTEERVQALGVRSVLMKPVPRARLARAIREALAASTGRDGA